VPPFRDGLTMVPVFVAMVFGRLGSVVLRLHVMPVSYVAVMAGFLVVTRMVVFSGRTMVFGRVFMVLGGLHMVISAFFRHGVLSKMSVAGRGEFIRLPPEEDTRVA
jgi:hypothetical protein